MKVEQAKQVLKNNGYNICNLWHVQDIKKNYICSERTAQNILNKSLTSEYIIEDIFKEIDAHCENLKLKKQ
jgi:hypothetical protein